MPPSRRIVSGFRLLASTRTPPALLLVLLATLAVVRQPHARENVAASIP